MQALAINWRDPTSSPYLQGLADFRLRSPVSAVVAGWLHLTAGPRFIGFHLALALLAIVVGLWMPAVRRSVELRALVGLLLIGGAIPAVLLSWVGSYDPVSLGAAAIAALAVRREVAAFAWMVFAFNNAPEAALSFVAVALVLLFDQPRQSLGRLAFGAAGTAAGYVGIRVLDDVWGGGHGEATYLRFYGFSRYASNVEHYWPLVIVGALGVGWLLAANPEAWRLPAARAFFVVSVLVSLALPPIALDTTRLTAGALWAPVLTTATILVRRLPVSDVRAVAGRMAPVALLLVLVVVWDGSLVYPGWSGLADMVRYLTGHKAIPTSF
jgi:hypothetical protein